MLGGSGKTGRLALAEALKRGVEVTALVRKASSLQQQDGLTIVEGTPRKLEDLQRAVKPDHIPTAIVSTLGQTRKSGNPWAATTSPPRFIAGAMTNAVKVAKDTKIPKLVVMSMWGTADSFDSLNFLMRFTMNHSNMAQTLEDHNLVDKIVKDSGLKYAMPRPTMLKEREAAPVQEMGDHGEQVPFMPSISTKTVAKFLVDAVESDRWDGRTPVIAG